ncbi:hypothetical protein PMIN05_000753 [Paraphaeosphaeria minitans]
MAIDLLNELFTIFELAPSAAASTCDFRVTETVYVTATCAQAPHLSPLARMRIKRSKTSIGDLAGIDEDLRSNASSSLANRGASASLTKNTTFGHCTLLHSCDAYPWTRRVELKNEDSVPKALELTGQKLKSVAIIAGLTKAENNSAPRTSDEGGAASASNGTPFDRLCDGGAQQAVSRSTIAY